MTENVNNQAHHIPNASDVIYGIWGCSDNNGHLSLLKNGITKKKMIFNVASYKIIIDFAAFAEVVKLIWLGVTNAHSTVQGMVSAGFETWGPSCQTCQHLVHRINKALKYVSDTLDISVKDN